MKRVIFSVVAALMFGGLCGCRSQIVTVDVVPADATVIASGVEYRNGCPMFIEACTGRPLLIMAYKDGYREKFYAIDYQLSTLGKIEAIAGAFLILPAFGLCFDNAWELKESNVSLTLAPVSKAAREEAAANGPRATGPVDITSNPTAKQTFSEL